MSDVGLACNKVAGCVGAVNAIPDGWSLDKLENFVTNKILGTTSRGTGLSNVLLLKMGNLKGGRINYDKVEYVENKEELQSLTLEYGDFLFNTRNTPELVGKVSNFCEKRLKAVYDNNLLRLKFNDYIDPIYMGYLFNLGSTVQQLKQIVAGTTSVAAIYWKDLALLKQIVPPLPEQQKIAQILTSVDDVIEKTQAQIDKLKDLKTGMMQELLNKGIGHLEFKNSAVGRIPVGWDVVPLGDVCELQVGYAFKSLWFVDTGVKLLRGDNVGFGVPTWERIQCISNEKALQYSNYYLNPDDIIIGMDRTFTKTGVKITKLRKKDVPALLVQRVGRFQSKTLDKDFLWQLVRSGAYINALKSQEKGMDIPHLSKTEILEPLVVVPSINEQKKIAKGLGAIDEVILSKEMKLRSTSDTKKALMQDLLTGKVRVNTELSNPTLAVG